MAATWCIELLGALRATRDGEVVIRLSPHKTGVLLGYLAYHLHLAHPRDTLIELLWPRCDPDTGRHRLRKTLSSLRYLLGPAGGAAVPLILADRKTIQVDPATVTTDVAQFNIALQAAARAPSAPERVQRLEEAVDLYRGELLPGCYDDWVLRERAGLAEAFLQALEQLLAHRERIGDLPGALQLAYRAVAADPLREAAHRDVMRLLAACGQPQAALRHYQKMERLLEQELESEPEEETRAIVVSLRALTSASGRTSSRRQRRKERVPAMVPREAEVPLPPQLTQFFGRETEVQCLCELLPGKARLVTLTGPGGCGKTRLALEVVARIRPRFPGGVWLVPLADLSDVRLLITKVRDSLRPPRISGRTPLEQVTTFLARRTAPFPGGAAALLLLDNFEHLVEDGAPQVGTLLEQVPGLTCLVTSRQRLDVAGEREFPVPPLPVPDVEGGPRLSGQSPNDAAQARPSDPFPKDTFLHCPSIQLFVDRAQAVRLGFELTAANGTAVAMLCARLEGLPLALELAAARAGVLTPEQMLAHLEHRLDFLVSRRRDAEPRHRTMRAALDWSYQLLLPDLRRFFARLSVFRGGFTLAAAEEVCEEPRALNRLEELHRCSLLLAEECGGEMRFRLLEILREYGREQLAPEEEATLVRRHGSFYLALAEQAVEEGFMGTNQVAWMSRLEQEHDNMRAALAAYLAADDLRMGLRLGAALAWFWGMAGYLTEGRENVAHLLELVDPYRTSDDPALAAVRSRALLMAVAMAYYQGDLAMSRQLGAESEALCRGLEDRFGLVGALGTQGMAAVAQGDLAAAQTYGEETLAIARADGGPFLVSWAHFALGNVLAERGDDLGARAQQEQVVRFARESGHDWALARGMSLGGYLALRQREFRSARARYEESLAMRRRLGDPVGTAWMLARLAHLARYEGELKRAASLLDESLTLARELRMRDLVAFVHYVRGRVALDEGRVDAAFDCFCESLVLRREGGEKPGMVQCLEGLAEEEEAQGRPGEAARFFGAAAAGRDALGMPLPPCDLPDVERHTASALEALGRSAFVAAWEAGRALSLEEAVAFALDESHEG